MSLPRIGPYEVVGTLGRGGMGVVYRVRHVELDVERALKVVLRADAQAHARFGREAAHLAGVRHDNVVAIHESGVHEGDLFFVMDLVQGRGLDSLLRDDGRPTLEVALRWAIGVCRGVDALHQQGIVHRDLKPANVIIDAQGRAVVVDLGLALAPHSDERLTKTGAIVGTLGYMAPEQVRAEKASPATDVFALGQIVHELVTGEPAVGADASAAEAMGVITSRDGTVPGDVDPELPARLDGVVRRATRADAAARYPRAGALADALEEVLRAPGPSRRVVTRRRRAILGAVAAAALVVTIVAAALAARGRPPVAEAGTGEESIVRALAALHDPAKVLARADAWLAENPAHPDRSRVEGRRRDARRQLGDDALVRLEARPDYDRGTSEHLASAWAWSTRFPDHPQAARVRNLVRSTSRRVPLTTLAPAHRARFVPGSDGARAVLADAKTTVALWDVPRRAKLREWPLQVRDLALSQDGATAYLLEEQRLVRVSLDDQVAPLELLHGPTDRKTELEVVALSADGRVIAVGRRDGVVHLIDAASGRARELPKLPSGVTALTFSRRGSRLFAANSGYFETGRASGLHVADASANDWLGKTQLTGTGMRLLLTPDDRGLLIGSQSGRIVLYDAEALERRLVFPGEGRPPDAASTIEPVSVHGWVGGLALTPDGKRVISSSHEALEHSQLPVIEGDLSTWDLAIGREVRDLSIVKRPVSMFDVDVSPSGDRVLVACGDQPAELWLRLPDE